jgi:site-specific DNA-methyltransferase (adenine-specific)
MIETGATHHRVKQGDARDLSWLDDESVHLSVTSPPYWTLKEYPASTAQLGNMNDYEQFLEELDRIWAQVFRVLVPGGRLVCVVGDVCVARRKNGGRHHVVPLHADIAVRCRDIGFDYLTPILWHKISNAKHEARRGSSFLGKPFEPNAIVKNDIEYILMLRKPGGYRKPSEDQRARSRLTAAEHARWFRAFWSDVPGKAARGHPAPFPVEIPRRLIRMFSFVGDTVLDPFLGTGTTSIAAAQVGRHSIGVELNPGFVDIARSRLEALREHISVK